MRTPDQLAQIQEEFRSEMRAAHQDVAEQIALLLAMVGRPSDDGKGGSGLFGEVRRMNGDLSGLLTLKNQGVGIVAALTLFGTLILMGIKGWLTAAVAVLK